MFFHFSHVNMDHVLASDRSLLIRILENQSHIMADLTKLTQAVTGNTTATNAAVAALSTPSTDQTAVDAATTQIEANTAALNAAVTPPVPTTPA